MELDDFSVILICFEGADGCGGGDLDLEGPDEGFVNETTGGTAGMLIFP